MIHALEGSFPSKNSLRPSTEEGTNYIPVSSSDAGGAFGLTDRSPGVWCTFVSHILVGFRDEVACGSVFGTLSRLEGRKAPIIKQDTAHSF